MNVLNEPLNMSEGVRERYLTITNSYEEALNAHRKSQEDLDLALRRLSDILHEIRMANYHDEKFPESEESSKS